MPPGTNAARILALGNDKTLPGASFYGRSVGPGIPALSLFELDAICVRRWQPIDTLKSTAAHTAVGSAEEKKTSVNMDDVSSRHLGVEAADHNGGLSAGTAGKPVSETGKLHTQCRCRPRDSIQQEVPEVDGESSRT